MPRVVAVMNGQTDTPCEDSAPRPVHGRLESLKLSAMMTSLELGPIVSALIWQCSRPAEAERDLSEILPVQLIKPKRRFSSSSRAIPASPESESVSRSDQGEPE
jgi:hypothetical protein